MKSMKKAVVLLLCVGAIAAASVFGTMAYFTSQDAVTNTFTVGEVYLTLDEAKVGTDGKALDPEVRTDSGNSYVIIPGAVYDKDPTVTVKENSEDSYVRMMVTITEQAALDEIFDPGQVLDTFFGGYDSNEWVYVDNTENGDDSRTYEFRYIGSKASNGIVPKATTDTELKPLFTTLKIPGEALTNENVAQLADLKITVVAHAIQALGFESADKAWEAFKEDSASVYTESVVTP